jgi:hypothetical protein
MPNVLQQGLRVYEVQKPLPHHLVDGAVSENIVFMNPDDVFVYHQGDDDGDTIAIDPNPIAVELFSMAMRPKPDCRGAVLHGNGSSGSAAPHRARWEEVRHSL